MATTIDIAQYIYNKLGWIDSGRLMKLTFYAQAWSLGWFRRSMVVEEFQAWPDGPVEPNLRSQTTYSHSSSTSTDLPSAEVDRLSDADKAIIDSVLDFYGNFSAQELIKLTQAETPWQEARFDVSEDEPSKAPLSQSSLKAFYALQEIHGNLAPIRPKIHRRHSFDNARDRLFSMAERWRTALNLRAAR